MLKDGVVNADGTPQEIINRKSMEELYDMKILIKENPLLQKPEIVPIRVMYEPQTDKPLRIHVICGEKGGVQLLEQLDNMGHRVSAGVLNQGSDDNEICEYLGIPRVTIPAFQPVGPVDQKRNLAMMADADVVIVADIPFGIANIHNLDGLEEINARLYMHEHVKENDFTGGMLEKRIREIESKKEVIFFAERPAGDLA